MTKWAQPSLPDGSVNLEHHEDTLREHVAGLFPDGGVFIDVGANVGLWTVHLGQRASRVIAVEPNPAAVSMLRENITLNGLDDIVQVLDVAAWDRDERLNFLNPSYTGEPMSGLMRVVPAQSDGILGVRLDDALPPVGRIDLMKYDTEGSDIRALEGAAGHIARFRPLLLVESHHVPPYAYYQAEDLERCIAGLGYEWERMTWAGQVHLLCRPRGEAP